MTEKINTERQNTFQNSAEGVETAGGGDSEITENDDEDVLENDTDAPEMDDLEDIDLDADMEDEDDDLDDDDDTAEDQPEGTQ